MVSYDQGADSAPPEGNGATGVGHRIRRGADRAKGRYAGSSAEHLWRRLDSMDFINRGLLFAATLLLCFFPFLIVANALAGRSTVNTLARHLGLNKQASADVSQLFTSSTATSNAITGTAWVFFILGGIAAATAIQELYERAFELDGRGLKDMLRRLIWLVRSDRFRRVGRLGRALAARRRRSGAPRHPRPGGTDRLLVVHHVVSAGGPDLVAGPVPGRPRHRRLLAGHGGRLFDHLLQTRS